jgi:asparagine synthase (glutamine-hydrolysing)
MLTTGFTFVSCENMAEFRPYTQRRELAESLLSYAQDDSLSLLLMGRLYYRASHLQLLRGRVEASILERCQQSDAALAQALYRVFGIERLCGLEGDFSLACHDYVTNRLVALRDPMGGYPLFYIQQGETIAISTSTRPLVDLLPSVELDTDYMVDYLTFPTDVFSEIPLRRTAYRGVQRLLPGWLVEANLSTQQVVCRPYWNWQEKTGQVVVRSVEEAGELVRESLEAAVGERLSRKAATGCHFSGGFDSTGLALLAGRLSAKRSKSTHAFSLVYFRDSVLSQEKEYIESALERSEGLVHHVIPADDLVDFVDHQRLPLLDEPSPLLGARFRLNELIAQTAAKFGVDTVMTGEGADNLFAEVPPSSMADLLGKGRVSEALRLASEYSHAYSQSPWSIFVEGLKLFLPHSLRDGIVPFLRGGRSNFLDLTERTIPPWFTDEFIRRHRPRRRILDRQSLFSRSGRMMAEHLGLAAGDWNNWHIGLPNGVVVSRPFWDSRMIALGLSLPKSLHVKPGRMKPVLAAALHDVLPEKILTRSRKSTLDILNSGLARNQSSLVEMIQRAPIPEEIINRTVLIDCLEQAGAGVYRDAISVGRLRLVLSYMMWTSSRADWMRHPIPTIETLDLDGRQRSVGFK